jgi:hypothetical protein
VIVNARSWSRAAPAAAATGVVLILQHSDTLGPQRQPPRVVDGDPLGLRGVILFAWRRFGRPLRLPELGAGRRGRIIELGQTRYDLFRVRIREAPGMHDIDESGHRVTDAVNSVFWSHAVF